MRLDPTTRQAIAATRHCLTGCAIGEVLGLALATAWGWSNGPTLALALALAFAFGYAFTVVPLLRAGTTVRRAVSLALAADTVSILTMEVIDNGVELAIPGAMDARLTDVLFWWSLALALVAAFILTVPVNRWLIARGKGHTVVHQAHGHVAAPASRGRADEPTVEPVSSEHARAHEHSHH